MTGVSVLDRRVMATVLAPLLVAALILGAQVGTREIRAPVYDELCYVTIADDLRVHGVFADGCFKSEEAGAAPGRFFAPVYPAFLWLVASLDSRLAASMRCHAENPGRRGEPCPNAFQSVVAIQWLLAVLGAYFVFLAGREIARADAVAWGTMLLVLAAGELGYYARTYLTENASLPAFFAFLYFLVRAVSRGERWPAVAAGAALALTALSRAAYLYLFPFVAIGLALALRLGLRQSWPTSGVRVVAFLAAGALVIAPWALRNMALFGDPLLTQGDAALSLAFRVAYNAMSWPEWFVAWIYWLPDFGDNLSEALFRPELYERLHFRHRDGYYRMGAALARETLEAAGSREAHLAHVVETYLLPDLVKHVLVTLPLALRGMWVGKYLALLGFALIVPVAVWMRRAGRLWPFLALLLPPLFMVGVHGFVSVNVVRYNIPMLAVFAFTTSVTAMYLAVRARDRWGAAWAERAAGYWPRRSL